MKRAAEIIAVAAAAALAVALVVLLIGSLRIQFLPVPTEYENTVWISTDGNFTLNVYEFDPETYQCRAELVYSTGQGSTVYQVLDESHGVMGLFEGSTEADKLLRTKCDGSSFTVRINRAGEPAYADKYGKNELVTFTRE